MFPKVFKNNITTLPILQFLYSFLDIPEIALASENDPGVLGSQCDLIAAESVLELNSLPWRKIHPASRKTLEAGKKLLPRELSKMLEVLAEYQSKKLKDNSVFVSGKIIQCLLDFYGESFNDTVGNEVVGNGKETLTVRLHNKVLYYECSK